MEDTLKKLPVIIITLSVLFLQGCAKPIKKSPEKLREQPPKMLKFQRCITDAKTLSQLDSKYEKSTKELYTLVNNVKFYASIADESSTNVSSTITPFFDYKLNEICNNISLMLIEEFQKNTINSINKAKS